MEKQYQTVEELVQEVLDNANREGIATSQVAYEIFLDGLGMTQEQLTKGFIQAQQPMKSISTLLADLDSQRAITELVSDSIAIVNTTKGTPVYYVYFINKGELDNITIPTDNLAWARCKALAIESCLACGNVSDSNYKRTISRVGFILGFLG